MSIPIDERVRLAAEVGRYLTNDLGLSLTSAQTLTLAHPELVDLVEFAHTPHFGHLGFARMLMVALSRCEPHSCQNDTSIAQLSARPKVLLFFLNDHVAANALPNIRHIPMLRGGLPLAQPPALGVKSSLAGRPLIFLPSPQRSSLLNAARLMKETLAFEASRGPKSLRKMATAGVEPFFEWLASQAPYVENFSSWVVRCWLLWLQEIAPDIAVWPVPSRRLTSVLPQYTQLCSDRRSEFAQIQERWTKAEGAWPNWSQMRSPGPDYFPFHGLCGVCRDSVSDPLSHPHPLELAPKVVARQPMADQLVLRERVAGGMRGYWPVAAEIGQLMDAPTTPRVEVTGAVKLRLPWGEEACPSVLRVAAQIPVAEWYESLSYGPPCSEVALNWPSED